MMSNEMITTVERPPMTAVEIRAQVNLIQEVMRAVMKKDTHYGVIPGVSKPSLWKPGAEKLLATFRISAQIKSVEDLSVNGEVRYRVTVKGVSTFGEILGEGIGEASSNQTKYAWREMICQQEYDETPEDQKRTIWKKGNPPYQVKQIKTNPSDQANTILKMAHKSALIAMCLVVTGASDIFTQDIEDMPIETLSDNGKTQSAQSNTPKSAPAVPAEINVLENVTVSQVYEQKTKTGKDMFNIEIDGKKYSTFSATHRNIAVDARDKKLVVSIQYKVNGNYFNLSDIKLTGEMKNDAQEEF